MGCSKQSGDNDWDNLLVAQMAMCLGWGRDQSEYPGTVRAVRMAAKSGEDRDEGLKVAEDLR